MRDKRNQKTVQKFLISAQFFDWPVMGSFFVSRFDKEPFMGQIVIGAVIHHAFQGLIDFLLQLRIIFGKGNRKIKLSSVGMVPDRDSRLLPPCSSS